MFSRWRLCSCSVQPRILSDLQPGAVTCIDFAQNGPHDYLVTAGTRIVVYDGATGREKRALTRFKDTVYSGTWRRDGQMVVCGSAKGHVQAVQPQSRAALRVFKGHTAPVHTTRFTGDGGHILSGGDDRSLRLWDVPTGACLGTLEEAHEDYIRCSAVGAAGSALAGMMATGSYDSQVKLWDVRTLGGGGGQAGGSGRTRGAVGEEEQGEEGGPQDLGDADVGDNDEENDDVGEGSGSEDGSSEGGESEEKEERDEEDMGSSSSSSSSASSVSDEAAAEVEGQYYSREQRSGAGVGAQKRPRDRAALTMDHGEPVTSVTLLPSGGGMVTTGSTSIKVWDIVGGGKLLHTITSHAKLVTGCCLDGTGTRLLSCGLDGLVKVHELATFTTVSTLRYVTPLLALGIGGDNVRLAVGDPAGGLHVRTRPVALGEALKERKEAQVLRGGTYRYFLRGATGSSSGAGVGLALGDAVASVGKKPKLKSYDVLLKGFQHGAALDAALDGGEPVVVASVLEELVARQALDQALSGREADSAARVVRWAADYVAHPRYANICIDVAGAAADAYGHMLGSHAGLDAAFMRLSTRIKEEVGLHGGLLSLQGCLDMLMAASTTGHMGTGPGLGVQQ